MWKYRSSLLVMVLLLNVSCIFFSISQNNVLILQNQNFSRLKGESLPVIEDNSALPVHPIADDFNEFSDGNKIDPQDSGISFSIQQQNVSPILHYTFDQLNESFDFVYNIWDDALGSDTFDPTLYENGSIDSSISASNSDGGSLFTRIGNSGNNESNVNTSLNDHYANISAGWRIEFPIQSTYSMINISLKWRFDTPDGAFDNYNDFKGEIRDFEKILDPSPDYQEIRCRITHEETDQSFWLGNPISSTNPNGTVYYRIGLNVTQDEIWHPFMYDFLVGSQPSNYTLELGAYLNTREYWNEYFDVWFDEILILGVTNVTDINPPQPVDTGLSRTVDISQYKFWANFSEGTWESPIKNVTIFYNQSGTYYNKILNSSLDFQPPSSVNEVGYNQTHWQFLATFNFSDNISYYFVVYDYANNSYVSKVQSTIIGDYTAPEITSSVINQTGKGFIDISIDVKDWGRGIDTITLNYTTLRGNKTGTINITDIGTRYYKANFSININLDYGDIFEFGISLNDTDVGNSEFYSGDKIAQMSTQDVKYPIELTNDVIDPEILYFNISASPTTEDRTDVNVTVVDDFGDISEVYLEVKYEDGTPHEKYSHVILEDSGVSTGISAIYKLRSMEGEPLLKLPYNGSYNITVYVFDLKGNNDSYTYPTPYIVQDIVAPIMIKELDIRYVYPGVLTVRAQVIDEGSGIPYEGVMLQRKTQNGWIDYDAMSYLDEEKRYTVHIRTNLLGMETVEFRINAIDNAGNSVAEDDRPHREYTTKIFFTTSLGLLITEIFVLTAFVSIFAAIKVVQSQQLKALRRRRFDVALGRSERLAYLGEEAIFGFIAAYGQSEDVSSILLWEPRLIGHFYQYLKELTDKANNNVSFVMQAKAQDQVTYVDFNIEQIGCSAIIFAYPVSTLPQQWLSALTLDQVPLGVSQGVLLLMLVMREKWTEIANNFQEEIADGVIELKDLICSGENKDIILKKAQEFRLFISGTLEVLDEIETETDEISDDIMGDFETEFLDIPDDDGLPDDTVEDEPDDQETSNQSSDNDSS